MVQKSGSFFSYGDTRLGQGRSNSKQFLAENPDIALEIENRILASARHLPGTVRRSSRRRPKEWMPKTGEVIEPAAVKGEAGLKAA